MISTVNFGDLNFGENATRVELHGLGMVKNKYWAFEDEWRYTVLGTFTERHLSQAQSYEEDPFFDLKKYPVREASLYLPLDEDCLNSVEILLGPCVTSAQRLIIEALVAKYTPNVKIRESDINYRC